MKKLVSLITVALVMLSMSQTVLAADPYQGYSYTSTDEGTLAVAAPQAYLPEKVYSAGDLGVTFTSPEDLLFDDAGNLYICDMGQNAVYVFSPEMQMIKTITTFTNNGVEDSFSSPYGIFLTPDGVLYVADYGNQRVVAINEDNEAVMVIQEPDSDLLSSTFVFQPQKVLVDSTNRIFILSKNVNEGIMQFTHEGVFLGFYGSNEVSASMIDRIWKEIMTDEQTAKLTQFVPVEYKNMSLDYKGFIYAVTKVSDVGKPVRRLNLSGGDVLVRNPINGTKQVVGDLSYPWAGVSGITGPSSFTDVTSDELGNYYVLDDKRGRIFAYDESGNMLFVFGALNSGQMGSFASPSAIVYRDHKVYALDRGNCELIVFEATKYATLMEEAMYSYLQQDYETSLQLWEEIIKNNNNCDLAYYKAGYCLYRLKDYKKAMEYFKLINAKEAYSDAAIKQANIDMNENFAIYASVAVAVAVGAGGLWIASRRRRRA